ncbi:hypothetical protein HOLleu_10021 [Holothuria leucospilota]|uniref:Uncharacterized protein n=1 Tax=Holothuria leucospilota TaxID=206669 RepID=A0A9Q1HFE4_HOLLE|nr:hypothetical protein HOLleu_10021 [Holothuria leucospilota]
MDRDRLLRHYFNLGLNYAEIQAFLAFENDIITSNRHLRRLGLTRRKRQADLADAVEFIEREIQSSGQCHGYSFLFFLSRIQEDIEKIQRQWNCHRIRHLRNNRAPHGRPLVMYSCPELYGAHDYLHAPDPLEVEVCREEYTFKDEFPCDEDFPFVLHPHTRK